MVARVEEKVYNRIERDFVSYIRKYERSEAGEYEREEENSVESGAQEA